MSHETQTSSISQDPKEPRPIYNRPSEKPEEAGTQEETPINFGARRAKINRWIPKRWESKYDHIVIQATLGLKSNKVLAEEYDFTPQQISNIINTPQAEKIRRAIHAKIQSDIGASLPMRLEELADKSLKRIETLINSDGHFEMKPFEIAALSLKVLTGVGKMKGESATEHHHNTIVFNKADGEDLKAALRLAAEAKRINNPEELPDPFQIIQKAG